MPRAALQVIERTLFPAKCAGCDKRGVWFCDQCLAQLKPVQGPGCYRCGRRTPTPVRTCRNCAGWPVGFQQVRAVYSFDGPLRRSIHQFKYQRQFARGRDLAELMVAGIEQQFGPQRDWDAVQCVPLHPLRARERGFDQGQVLATGVAAGLERPLLHGLERHANTRSQVGLGMAERRTNVHGAFRADHQLCHGKSILLIDDVVTTGSTFLAAATELLDAGARRVDALALARDL